MATALAAALLKAQAEMPQLQRDKINPGFKSRYLSLETLLAEVLPILNSNGIVVMHWPTYVATESGLEPAVRQVLCHAETGEQMEDTMLLLAAKKDPQGQGSAITYAKRYMLTAALGISADEDDDGNAASGRARGSRQSANGATISKAQRDRLFAIAGGLATERVKELVREHAGVESSNDIPKAKYDALIAAVEKEKAA